MVQRTLQNSLELMAIMSSIVIVGLGTGLTIPLVSVKLTQIGASLSVIGIMAATPALGILLAAPFASKLSLHFSIKKLLLLAVVLSEISIIMLFILKPALGSWFILRLIMGIAAGVLVVLGESYINHVVDNSMRGRMVAIYTSSYTFCQVAGPSLLAWFGTNEVMLITAITLIHSVALFFLLMAPCNFIVKAQKNEKMGLMHFMRYAPVIAVAVFLFALFDTTVLSLIPLYGMDYHFSEQDSLLMISAIFAGDACLQIPLGWLADHFDRKKIHFYCGLITLLLLLALPLLMRYPIFLWPALMLLGGAAGGIYTLALIRVGETYTGHRLIKANAAIAFLFGFGSLFGPLIGSVSIALLGVNGLILMLIFMTFVFIVTSMLWPVLSDNETLNNN